MPTRPSKWIATYATSESLVDDLQLAQNIISLYRSTSLYLGTGTVTTTPDKNNQPMQGV